MFTLILIGVLTALIFVYFKHKYSYWERKGIKGPKAFPFLGTLLAENKYKPKETEERFFKEFGPVFGTYQGVLPVLNISRVDLIKEVLSDLKRFPLRNSVEFNDTYISNSIIFKNGADWKQARSVQTYYFTGKKFRNLLPHFEKCSANLLENIALIRKEAGSNDVEIKELSKFYGLDVISKVLYSIDVDSYKERDSPYVYNATHIGDLDKIKISLMMILPTPVSKFIKLNPFDLEPINRLGDYFKKMLKERRENGVKYNDLSEILQDAVDDEKVKLTENEVIGNILLAFFAGLMPVSDASTTMLALLSEHQDVQDKLRKEILKKFSGELDYEALTSSDTYLDSFVNEAFRFGNNSTGIVRTAAEDTKLGEYSIDKGTELRLVTYLLNLSDHYYHPMVFNPDRWLKGSENENKPGNLHIPFGLGHKQCLGQRLALLELKCMLVRVLKHYRLSKPDDNSLPITEHFRGFTSINKQMVKFTPISD